MWCKRYLHTILNWKHFKLDCANAVKCSESYVVNAKIHKKTILSITKLFLGETNGIFFFQKYWKRNRDFGKLVLKLDTAGKNHRDYLCYAVVGKPEILCKQVNKINL